MKTIAYDVFPVEAVGGGRFHSLRFQWPSAALPAKSPNTAVRKPIISPCCPVPEENLFDIWKSEFPCPSQGSRPRFVIGQVGRGTAL
jgi:hypothetical protein